MGKYGRGWCNGVFFSVQSETFSTRPDGEVTVEARGYIIKATLEKGAHWTASPAFSVLDSLERVHESKVHFGQLTW